MRTIRVRVATGSAARDVDANHVAEGAAIPGWWNDGLGAEQTGDV